MVDPRVLKMLDPSIEDPSAIKAEFKEHYWPKVGDFKDHVRWFLSKNPDKTREDAVIWAHRQIDFQIAISESDICRWESLIKQEHQKINKMKALKKEE